MEPTDATNAILVTAATWYIAGQTMEAIKKMNLDATVVAGVYEKSKRSNNRELWSDADETYFFDANKRESLDFSRYNVVCIIPSTNAGRLTQFYNMIDECKHSESRPFVVFCSVADTFGYDGDFAKSTRHMEAMLESSGLQYVIINCGFFHQNFEWNSEEMKKQNKIRLPVGNGKFAPVDARDVARLIASIMKDTDHHEGNRYSMVGQQLMGGEGAARIASQALRYPIEFEDIPETVYFQDLQGLGCSPGMAKSLCELCAAIKKHDLEQTVTGPLLVKLHNRMIKLKEYFENYAHLYEGGERITAEKVREEEKTETEPVEVDEGYAETKEEVTERGEGWQSARERGVQYGRQEREERKPREAERVSGEGWEVSKGTKDRDWEEPVRYGREEREAWKPVEVERGRGEEQKVRKAARGRKWGEETAPYGREEREERKPREAERGRGEEWLVRKTTRGREEEEVTGRAPPPVEEERVVAIERDVYYLKPQTEKRVDVLRKARRDYEDLLELLNDTIRDWNEMLMDRRAALQGEEGVLQRLEDRKSEIAQALRQLDREIQEQERSKDRPVVVYPTSLPPITKGMHLVSRHDEKLEGGNRRVERYQSQGRDSDYERIGQRAATRYPEERRHAEESRYPEERVYLEDRKYPKERRERQSASGTHLGREMDRGRTSTKLGRELQNYKGENFIAKISQILYGWKDKGEHEQRSRGGRDVEGGYYRHETEYNEPRRESELVVREYEERPRRDQEQEDREREKRRRLERDREREERRRLEQDREERRRFEQDREEREERRRLEQDREEREQERRRLEQDREEREERRRLEQDREEHRRLDSERQDRENEERRRYERELREYETERPKETRPESTKRVSFRGSQEEEERRELKYGRDKNADTRARRRESGYASESDEYVLIPKRLIRETLVTC